MSDRALIVLGMHRSGTSALTGALRFLGVHLGNDLLEATEANTSGYWEHAGIVALHDQIFRKLRSAWDDVHPLPERWWCREDLQPEVARIARVVETTFTGSGMWGIKDPRMCRLMPFWQDLLGRHGFDTRYLLVTRNPLEVAASLARRDGFTPEKSAMLWVQHLLDMEIATRGLPRVWVPYHKLLTEPANTFTRVAKALDIEWPVSWQAVGQEISQFLNPTMRHHRAQQADDNHGFAMKRALEMYAWVDQEDEPEEHFHAMDRCRIEWDGILHLPGDMIRTLRLQVAELARDIEIARQAHGIRDEREQALRAEIQRLEEVVQNHGGSVSNGFFNFNRNSSKWTRILNALRNIRQPGAKPISLQSVGDKYWRPSHRKSLKEGERQHLSFGELIPEIFEITDLLTESIYEFSQLLVGVESLPDDIDSDELTTPVTMDVSTQSDQESRVIVDSVDLIGLLNAIDHAFRVGIDYLRDHQARLTEVAQLRASHRQIEIEIEAARKHITDLSNQIEQAKSNNIMLEKQIEEARRAHYSRDKLEASLQAALEVRDQELLRFSKIITGLQGASHGVADTEPVDSPGKSEKEAEAVQSADTKTMVPGLLDSEIAEFRDKLNAAHRDLTQIRLRLLNRMNGHSAEANQSETEEHAS